MILKKLKPLLFLSLGIFGFYATHKTVFYLLDIKLNLSFFNFSLEELYLIFSTASFLVTTTSIIIKQKNIDLVGNVFMLVTCIKMIICFLIIRPFSKNPEFVNSLEKYNYLVMFLIFLILETTITVGILNKKEN